MQYIYYKIGNTNRLCESHTATLYILAAHSLPYRIILSYGKSPRLLRQ